jgi:hypothetical protein
MEDFPSRILSRNPIPVEMQWTDPLKEFGVQSKHQKFEDPGQMTCGQAVIANAFWLSSDSEIDSLRYVQHLTCGKGYSRGDKVPIDDTQFVVRLRFRNDSQ